MRPVRNDINNSLANVKDLDDTPAHLHKQLNDPDKPLEITVKSGNPEIGLHGHK